MRITQTIKSGSINNTRYDLIIRRANLEGYTSPMDIAITNGVIMLITTDLPSSADADLDASGCIASHPLIDPHTHLDKCFLQPTPNISGTLDEAISIMQGYKGEDLLKTLEKRVERALEMAVRNGTLAIRTHVDITPTNEVRSIEALVKVRERWADLVDIQIVAFPQEGICRHSNMVAHLKAAIRMGADVIGGIPAIEENRKDAQTHIDQVFELATEFNVPVDMHIDESDDPSSRTLEMLAKATLQAGWQNRVCAAHCCSLASQDDGYASKVIEHVAAAEINIVTNPAANLVLQGRADHQPIRRGITRVKELLAAGVNVACGSDNLGDVFYPFGQADMLEAAFLTSLSAHMTGQDEIKTVMEMPRYRAATCIGLTRYGISEGNPANIILIPADTVMEALAFRPSRLAVIRNGQIICETRNETSWYIRAAG